MIIWLFGLLRKLKRAIATNREPRLLSRGVGLGFVLGIIPPGNLINFMVLAVIFCMRLNHAVAALTAIAVSFIAPWMDPVTNWIGTQILNDPPLHELAALAWKQPMIAWTNLNNTVVLGSVLIGTVLYWPLERTAHTLFKKLIKETPNGSNHQETADEIPPNRSTQLSIYEPVRTSAQLSEDSTFRAKFVTQFASKAQLILSSRKRVRYQESIIQDEQTSRVEEPSETDTTRIDAVRIQRVNVHPHGNTMQDRNETEAHPMDPQLRLLLSRLREQARRKAS